MRNKKGETLVEIMISVTILAIITVPLLHPFVTSAKVNSKAKRLQNATTIAKNEMEFIKSTNVSNVAKSGEYAEYLASGSVFRRADDAASSIVIKEDSLGNDKKYFVGHTNESYCFVKQHVKAGGLDSDVLIEYTKDHEGGLSKIYSMNRSDCAYYAESNDFRTRAVEYFVKKNDECYKVGKTRFVLTREEAEEKMTKTVTVSVEKDSTYGNTIVTVTYTFDIGDQYTSADDRYFSEETLIFDNFSTNAELSAVYIYYFPLYGIATGGRDNFVINNLGNLPIDIFFIAMNNSGTTALAESNYKASILVNEKAIVNVDTLKTKIHSNVLDIKWNKTSSNPLVNARRWEITNLDNQVIQQLSYNVKVTVFKHSDDCYYTDDDIDYFDPSKTEKICSMTSSALDSSLKETVR